MNIFASKKIQLGVTLSLCLAIIAAGSIAWISATQKALNAFSFSPEGVNLHDDFNDPNKDVYVENSGTEPLLVRVKLREFTEIGREGLKIPANGEEQNQEHWSDHDGVTTMDKCTAFTTDSGGVDRYIHEYWHWLMGGEETVTDKDGNVINAKYMEKGQKWYVPADSDAIDAGSQEMQDMEALGAAERLEYLKLAEDASIGDKQIAEDGLPSTMKQGSGGKYEYESYDKLLQIVAADKAGNDSLADINPTDFANRPETLQELYDARDNAKADLHAAIASSGVTADGIRAARDTFDIAQVDLNDFTYKTYGVQQTRQAEVMTMTQWKAAGSPIGDYWVINPDDGWFYWASPLEAGEATGLLLDAVIGSEALKDKRTRYYYGIDVIMQAVTVDDTKQFWDPDNDDARAEIREYGEAIGDAKVLLYAVAKQIDPTFTADLAAGGSGGIERTVGTTRAGIATTEEIEKGKFWYLIGDLWKYYDGRWLYDGNDWSLDGETYPFDPAGWFLSAGEWHYLDEYWFFDGVEWIELKVRATSKAETTSKAEEAPAVSPPEQSAATESSTESSIAESTASSEDAAENPDSGEVSGAAEQPEGSGETQAEP